MEPPTLELAMRFIYPEMKREYCDHKNGARYMHDVMHKTMTAYIAHMHNYGLPAYDYEEIEGAKAFRDAMNLAATQYINETY